jgi:ubiquinone biosynthesis protein
MGTGGTPWMAALGCASTDEKIREIAALLESPAGRLWRSEAGAWVTDLTPLASLVPESARRWRPLVADALHFIFSRLSSPRLAAKIVEQAELPVGTAPEKRLIHLISRMPGLQKIGQVLARNRRLAPELRKELTQLENGMSDMRAVDVGAVIRDQLGSRMQRYRVELAADILSEASVSAVIGFTWRNPRRERQHGVFKVLKPYVPECFAEDMSLMQGLGNHLAAANQEYGFALPEIDQMITEVRLLLERELDYTREQATLTAAARTYRSTLGVRVPRVIEPLCTARITALSEETGVKVTDAFRRSPIRRGHIAEQIVEALIAVPLFSNQDPSIFHADPHAGNLLYDEPNRELIVLDWALAEQLSLESRRRLVMLVIMTVLENPDGVREAVRGLRKPGTGRRRAEEIIDRAVNQFFAALPKGSRPGVLDAMQLLDEIALQGVHFTAPLLLFRKSLFTLDGVLQDVTGSEVRMDYAIVRHFLTRWAASFGLFYSPLGVRDFLKLEWNALLYPARRWQRRAAGAPSTRQPA